MELRLDGKVTVITGGWRGIGKAIGGTSRSRMDKTVQVDQRALVLWTSLLGRKLG